ncbi:hypothetical protein FRC19_009327 [Serendipita sp. 401]|nr:hypothetical protein FRC19_009327 [Serendipita sp. 401]
MFGPPGDICQNPPVEAVGTEHMQRSRNCSLQVPFALRTVLILSARLRRVFRDASGRRLGTRLRPASPIKPSSIKSYHSSEGSSVQNASYLSSSPVVPLSQPAQTVSSENVGLRATSALIQSVSEDLLRAHQQHEQEQPVEQSGYRPSQDMYSAFCNLMDRSRVADFLISDGDRALDEPAVVTTNSLQVKEVDRKTWVL